MARRYQRLNEIHFVDRDEFLQMAPAIVQLEITRLCKMLTDLEPGSDVYTAVVATRYHLTELLKELSVQDADEGQTISAEHLRAAIMCLSVPEDTVDETIQESLVYVADRLGYILLQVSRLR